MGFTTAMEAFVMLFLSVVLLVQGILTVMTYSKEKKPQDLTYLWSWMVIIFAGLGSVLALVIWGSKAQTAVEKAGGVKQLLEKALASN